MIYRVLQPPPALSGYVRCFWFLEGSASAAAPYVHRTMADGCPELIFHYNGIFNELAVNGNAAPSFRSGIHAQSSTFRRFIISGNFGIFGAYLYPFAIPAIFGAGSASLSNLMPDLHALLGAEGRWLEERMMTAKSNRERANVLTEFLQQRIHSAKHPEKSVISAIRCLIGSNGMQNIGTLASDHCLSLRQFERKFKAWSGFSPKLYARINRFQFAVRQTRLRSVPLTEIALVCGYYDQSHFIHDFREFSGYHPGEYFREGKEASSYLDA